MAYVKTTGDHPEHDTPAAKPYPSVIGARSYGSL